jgi:glycine cleavage system H lipoate-binding protein
MTVILVFILFAFFVCIDYLSQREPVQQPAAEKPEPVAHPRLPAQYVGGFDLPEICRYHPGHTWALAESPSVVRVGLDDFAARLIGRFEGLVLPKCGQWVRQGENLAIVFRDGVKTELLSPVEGQVTHVNEAVLADPALEPYGRGWLVSVFSPDAQTSFRNLLAGNMARSWMSEAATRLFGKMSPLIAAAAHQRDVAVHQLIAGLPDHEWADLTAEFFLTGGQRFVGNIPGHTVQTGSGRDLFIPSSRAA